jgi:predicted N-acetyltransferase YhbS
MPSKEDLIIRVENSQSAEESALIRSINETAFGGTEEADLVDKLRADDDAVLSLVAEMQKRLVGHVLFSLAARPARGSPDCFSSWFAYSGGESSVPMDLAGRHR